MKDTITIIETIVKEGRKLYDKNRKDKTKDFRLSLDNYPTGNLISRHLIALGYSLSFTTKYASWKGLVGLPYCNHKTQTVVDCGMPDILAVNLVITQVAKEVCHIEIKDEYYLTKDEIETAYKIAKAKAKAEAKVYKAYSGYADKDTFEIGEADA